MGRKKAENGLTEYVGVRVTKEEFEHVKKMSETFADGNISKFVRFAALKFHPDKKHLTYIPPVPAARYELKW